MLQAFIEAWKAEGLPTFSKPISSQPDVTRLNQTPEAQHSTAYGGTFLFKLWLTFLLPSFILSFLLEFLPLYSPS
jgi:hypothetical protein